MITASDVAAGGGFGYGAGTAPEKASHGSKHEDEVAMKVGGGSGGGGGGGSTGRPVAAIVVGPDGVKVRPIVDVTKVALAGITAWGSIAFMALRLSRAKKS